MLVRRSTDSQTLDCWSVRALAPPNGGGRSGFASCFFPGTPRPAQITDLSYFLKYQITDSRGFFRFHKTKHISSLFSLLAFLNFPITTLKNFHKAIEKHWIFCYNIYKTNYSAVPSRLRNYPKSKIPNEVNSWVLNVADLFCREKYGCTLACSRIFL